MNVNYKLKSRQTK